MSLTSHKNQGTLGDRGRTRASPGHLGDGAEVFGHTPHVDCHVEQSLLEALAAGCRPVLSSSVLAVTVSGFICFHVAWAACSRALSPRGLWGCFARLCPQCLRACESGCTLRELPSPGSVACKPLEPRGLQSAGSHGRNLCKKPLAPSRPALAASLASLFVLCLHRV